ncbi:MAG: hypothetical protein EP329_17880 [Deltaproteobacteria bacterium]|nr:MAG: hypothetical protein EP329_17880 [Deltaproteobacteria bacterium]
MTSRLVGNLRADQIRSGVVRGPAGLFQRRARPHVFGEPAFDVELVPEEVCAARPHAIAWSAHGRMVAAAAADGVETGWLAIRSAYRSVALQAQIWDYRLNERREARRVTGLPPLPERELERQQRLWTARPGQSAHHTGFALDLALYPLGTREGRRSPAYRWLAEHARRFGFYPYLPEPWHWEYDPPGLVAQVAELRRRLTAGEPADDLLRAPDVIPVASPAERGRLPATL